MHTTIFDTPVIHTLLYWLSRSALRLLGWRVEGVAPTESRYVLIAAPHTSNWDFPVTLMVCSVLGLKVYWMGKASLFNWPFGGVMRWLGGIAVDRSKSSNLVQSTVAAFERSQRLAVIIPPEGTRDKVMHWKTGFYYIAVGAKVPVALAFLDFRRKVGGIGKMLHPSGDIEVDMQEIKQFYAGITGKNPHQF
ncbi:lysophospholipid acyltransferase family protein [Actimicrobium antarcticum]|uniref:Lysophospholipid acyltransferase family protein n=1 Tax=Actimicrobium antarcticum TaxID=1051899 RepID=A0ABP7TTL8_9BURK